MFDRQRSALIPLAALLCLSTACQRPETGPSYLERSEYRRRAMDLLVRATRSPFDDVAMHALEALADAAPREAVLEFRTAARSDSPPRQYAGLLSLGRIRDRQSLSLMAERARSPDPRVRLAAAYAALRSGGETDRYAPILVRTLERHRDENLRADAAWLLGRLGDRGALQWLDYFVRRERSPKVRTMITAAQAMLGDDEAFERLITLTTGERASRAIALQTLVEMRAPRARDAFRDRLYAPPEDEFIVLRLLAARGLGLLGSDEGWPLATRMADDERPVEVDDPTQRPEERMKIRVNAALALGAIGNPDALPLLLTLARLQDDPRIQVAACWAILQIMDDQNAERLNAR